MNSKVSRLRTISQILNAQIISNQDQLTKALANEGINITQATLSRDLRDLRAEKKVLPDGSIKYVIPVNPTVEKKVLGVDTKVTRLNIRSIDFCGEFAVVKTRPGYANAVAYDIDDRGIAYVLGTIAGDDTILVIPKPTATRRDLEEFLSSLEN